MAKNGKRSDKNGKRGKGPKRDKRGKRSQLAPAVASARDLTRNGPAALAVAAGALIVAGITTLWRIRH